MILHYQSEIGMQVIQPSRFCLPIFQLIDMPSIGKWEKRKTQIIYKAKLKRRFLNYLLIGVLTIVGSLVIFSVLIIIAGLVNFVLFSMLIGILIGFLSICWFYYLCELIPTNTDYIKLKHRNKYY